MKSILHLLAGTERGGCEINALNLIIASPHLQHYLLVLGSAGPMSPEFERVTVEVRHAAVQAAGHRRKIDAIEEAVTHWNPSGIIAWHGMVALPEILHALRDFTGKVLVHGGNPAHTMPRLVDWRYYLTEKFLGKRCEAGYLCCSQHVADSFERSQYLSRFPRLVVPNGVQARSTAPHQPKPWHPDETFRIGMTARLDRIKDHATLLRAFSLVLAECPGVRLELAGDGDCRNELEDLAEDLGILKNTRFLGMIANVYEAMQEWDLFVYSTTDKEGLGNALIEAMMCGLPCIATDTGPIREIVGQLAVEKLVRPSDPAALAGKILALIPDLESRERLAAEGRSRAEEKFSQRTFAETYLRELNMDEGSLSQ
jgi:glycosyltransferase involved in cell wall biosynthesis